MIDINIETANIIKLGLELMTKFSEVDENACIDLSCLPLTKYNNPDNWLLVLMRMLFINSSKEISHEPLLDISDIVSVLERFNDEEGGCCYEWHIIEFLGQYGYGGCDEETENSDEYLEDYLDYFTSLDIRELKLYSPLVSESNAINIGSFIEQVPYLIGPYYGLSRNELIGCEVQKDSSGIDIISIYYFHDDYGDFYKNVEQNKTYSEFLKVVEMCCSKSELEKVDECLC